MLTQNDILSVSKKSPDQEQHLADGYARAFGTVTTFLFRFLLFFATWLVLSGMYDLFHMGLGVLASCFITWLSADIFPPSVNRLCTVRAATRLIAYTAWLLLEIAKANVWMLYLVFHPKLYEKISPRTVTFRTSLKSPLGLTMLANSMTLTPGTITAEIDERGYVSVHAIDDRSAAGVPGELERKIIRILGEE
ncbi:MAG: Na+/H+ antiporter subunit E [Syntrophobacteraceae bacterium]